MNGRRNLICLEPAVVTQPIVAMLAAVAAGTSVHDTDGVPA